MFRNQPRWAGMDARILRAFAVSARRGRIWSPGTFARNPGDQIRPRSPDTAKTRKIRAPIPAQSGRLRNIVHIQATVLPQFGRKLVLI